MLITTVEAGREIVTQLLHLLLVINSLVLRLQLLCGSASLPPLPSTGDYRLGFKVSEQVLADALDSPTADKVDYHRRSQTEFELSEISPRIT